MGLYWHPNSGPIPGSMGSTLDCGGLTYSSYDHIPKTSNAAEPGDDSIHVLDRPASESGQKAVSTNWVSFLVGVLMKALLFGI